MIKMNYWIISDPHFGHEILTKKDYRPKGYEYLILNNMHDMIDPDDILLCLGDVSFYKQKYWHELLMKVDCKQKILVKGNHDKQTTSWYYKHGWDFVCDSFTLKIYGKQILFSHIPENAVYADVINIHGHLHENPNRIKENINLIDDYHKLIKMEHGYKPVNLRKLLNM